MEKKKISARDRRARIKSDPILYAKFLERERKNKKPRLRSEMSPEKLAVLRERGRKSAKAHYYKGKLLEQINE